MRLTSKGQVTIPRNIHRLAGFKPCDEAIVLLRGSGTAQFERSADE